MDRQSWYNTTPGNRYALCVGIGQYTNLPNGNLRYAIADAQAIADVLRHPERGTFQVTLLTEPSQTTRQALVEALDQILNAPQLKAEDIVVIYLSCHGSVYGKGNTFYLLPSDAMLEEDSFPKKTTVIDIHDLAKIISGTRVKNILLLLDACFSGGAGVTLQYLNLGLDLSPETNLFIIGAARHDQVALQASSERHGLFTSCLLQAFEQKPRRNDGWLTISDIQSFITEAIKKFKTTNAVQIQGVSTSVNPNLLITKNLRYSAKSLEFYEQVRKLLMLIQYEPIDIEEPRDAPAGFYIANIKVGLKLSRVGIIPYYNLVEVLTHEEAEKIAHFIKEQIELENLDQGILVTMLAVSIQVKNVLKNIGGRSIVVRAYDSIWKGLIDFKKYLGRLIKDYEINSEKMDEPSLAQVYIPLDAERRLYNVGSDKISQLKTAVTYKVDRGYRVIWQGNLEGEIINWLADTTTSRLAILGDYGSGKTAFCRHLAALLSKKFLEEKEDGYYGNRIPLVIPLLDFAKAPFELESFLIAFLRRYCEVDNPNFHALMRMAEAGLFLFMLDGFDEMASRASSDTILQNIALFERLANLPRNKVLLTARPEYFMNFAQEQKVLRSYPVLYLQPLSKEQVNFYLQRRMKFTESFSGEPTREWTYFRQKIDEIHDLSDLARRPVLLEMIIKTLPTLIAEERPLNRPNLYQGYLEGELERQLQKQRRDLQIDRHKRFEIMEHIALDLYRTDKIELTSNQISQISKKLLTPEQQGEMEASLREILTCSFLLRIGDGYRFSHQSFMDYLVACYLIKDISQDRQENFRVKPISLAIRDFLLELEASSEQRRSKTSNAVSTNASFDYKKLEAWFCSNPRDVWVSSNVISILAKLLTHEQLCELPLMIADLSRADLSHAGLSHADLSYADLSYADLSYADLSYADLSYINLSNANLSNADLRGVNLTCAAFGYTNLTFANLSFANLNNADLRNADLRGANLFGASLERTDLRNTDLQFLNLRRASLFNSDLSKAILSGVDLSYADLNGANLSQADLDGADLSHTYLRGVDLSRADLSGADLSGADLSGADLSGADLIETHLSRADLSGADFGGTDLRGADFSGADFRGADLKGADFSGADFREANLSEVDLSHTDCSELTLQDLNLDRANLSEAILRQVNLSGANLTEANLSRADLDGADFRGADLSRADLSHADLYNVKFGRACLSGAKLDGSNLSGADLSNVDLSNVDLSNVDLSNANLGGLDLELVLSNNEFENWSNYTFFEEYQNEEHT